MVYYCFTTIGGQTKIENQDLDEEPRHQNSDFRLSLSPSSDVAWADIHNRSNGTQQDHLEKGT
jgi:hypothetical protein